VKDLGGRAASLVTGIAVALVIVAIAILPFLTPQWIAFEQGRSQAAAWTGFTPDDLRTATDAILSDLVWGPPAFDVEIGGVPVLNERERQHMRDVRTVFMGLYAAAVASVVVLAVASRRRDRIRLWRSVARGAVGLIVGTVILGVVALIAFDQLFELFHRIFFPAGSYLFDPATDRLVQLFPFQFWQETAMAVGALIIVLALITAWLARRRAGRAAAAAALAAAAHGHAQLGDGPAALPQSGT
jgi:integral membrane protein (TIGR01906 family)